MVSVFYVKIPRYCFAEKKGQLQGLFSYFTISIAFFGQKVYKMNYS